MNNALADGRRSVDMPRTIHHLPQMTFEDAALQ
jgi:hypothetical protein